MPIEAMITDANRVTCTIVYRQLLEAFLSHINDRLEDVFGEDWYD